MVKNPTGQPHYPTSLIAQQVRLQEYTSLKCGGMAELYAEPPDAEALLALLTYAGERMIPCTVIGCGTNLLVDDEGIPGLVLSTRAMTTAVPGSMQITADAGVPVALLVAMSISRGWRGLERLAGLPGSLGGAVFGNAGCFGREISECIVWVEYVDSTRVVRHRSYDPDDYRYRDSIFKQEELLITRACLHFDTCADPAELEAEAAGYCRRREEAGHYRAPSAGSVFRKPIIPSRQGTDTITSAGELVERSGLRGYSCGGALIAPFHANFIINPRNSASSKDVLDLIETAQKRVRDWFGIEILCEIRYAGKGTAIKAVNFGISPNYLEDWKGGEYGQHS